MWCWSRAKYPPEGALPIKKMPTRVTSLQKVSADVMLIQLQLPANDSFQYKAGQYIEILLRDGARRSYSMANAPQGNSVELHIRHMPGENSPTMCSAA